MILYQNSIVVLEYDPSTDILSVVWPNRVEYLLPELRDTLKIMVEYIRNYDVKKLLTDLSNTADYPELIDSLEYKKIINEYGLNLNQTRLQKSARIVSKDLKREIVSQKVTKEVSDVIPFKFSIKDFTTVEEAKKWLMAD